MITAALLWLFILFIYVKCRAENIEQALIVAAEGGEHELRKSKAVGPKTVIVYPFINTDN